MADAITPDTYKTGVWEPTEHEYTVADLEVTGALPPELSGRYFRNGSDAPPGSHTGHLFLDQGMIHGIRLRAGRAEWYRNRWVRTPTLEGGPSMAFRPDGSQDSTVVQANTHVIPHGDRIVALQESGLPYEVDQELNTVGVCDFGGALSGNLTAHPKVDPDTGDLHAVGCSLTDPTVTYYVIDPKGQLVHSVELTRDVPTFMHDMGLTEHYVLIYQTPMRYQLDLLERPTYPIIWDDRVQTRIGILPRDGGADQIRWVDIDPCVIVHTANCREDNAGRIIYEGTQTQRADWEPHWAHLGGAVSGPDRGQRPTGTVTVAQLHRWIIDPRTGQVWEEDIDDRSVEFPSINEAFTMRENRHLYMVGYPGKTGSANSLLHYDLVRETQTAYDFPSGQNPGEPEFVPAENAGGESDGWLISLVSGIGGAPSELVVLDATALADGPVARVHIPHRVPMGVHGTWIPDQM
ncbi:carotenoid oxygenase family protein [Nocardia sp. NPDC049149]|uniref:carotenoid oxygenase family protein n=1 Tax=Nocardia sp. NPDC049149 TaxID=3364315 RepID=UPI003715E005